MAFGTTCDENFPSKIENCKTLSANVKSSCEFAVKQKMATEALALLNNSTSEDEKRRGLLVLKGSQNTNDKIDLTVEIQKCEIAIGEFKPACSDIKDVLYTCVTKTSVDSLDGDEPKTDDWASSTHEAEKTLASSEKKLRDSKEKIEKIDKDIDENIVSLCEDEFGPKLKSGCNKPSAEFKTKAQQSFSSCAQSEVTYNSTKCIAAVKPSADLNIKVANAPAKVAPTTETTPQPNPQSRTNTDAPPVKTEAPAPAPVPAPTQAKAPVPVPAPAQVKTEPKILPEATLDSAKSSKNSDFKAPSIGTIAKYALLGALAYGAVTGKLKTWGSKILKAINPLAKNPKANSGERNIANSTGGTVGSGSTTSGCTGSYNGRIAPPAQSVRLANRDRQLREGNPLGGGVDGGIYLEGAFEFKTGPLVNGACQILPGSRAIIHGSYSNFSGSVRADKSFAFGHEGGPVTGSVNGSSVSGKLAEGGGREWVYGDLVGTFTPN